jgi:hypothetical protein
MFRFTIRDVLWLTVVVAMGVVVWKNQRTTRIERTSLEEIKRELDSRRASLDKEWNYLEKMAQQGIERMDVRVQRSIFLAGQVPKADIERAIKRSAELGAPQPKPLPPGYGEQPNQE